MADHDPMCISQEFLPTDLIRFCDCKRVARIRADERECLGWDTVWPAIDEKNARITQLEKVLTDLRAKVLALPERGISMTWDHPEGLALVRRDEVLALLDGSGE